VFKIFTIRFWLDVDIWLNQKLFNGRRETMSERMGRMLLKGKNGFLNWRYHLCRMLSAIERQFKKGVIRHCKDSVRKED